MPRHLFASWLAIAVLSGALHAFPQARLKARNEVAVTATFAGNTITAAGITPGKSAVFFGITFFGPNDTRQLVRWKQIVTDDDGDGTVALSSGDVPLTSSLWVVADLASGRFAVGGPPSSAFNPAAAPRQLLRQSLASGPIDRLTFDHPLLDMLYVDPGHGAWVWYARDGGYGDKDGANGLATVDLADGQPLSGSGPPPTQFSSGGVLIAIDWYQRAILATPIAPNDLAGAP